MLNSSPYHKTDWLLETEDVKNLPWDQKKAYRDAVRFVNENGDTVSAFQRFRVLDSQFSTKLTGIDFLGKFNGSISGPIPGIRNLNFFLSGSAMNEDSYLPYGFTLDRVVSGRLSYQVVPTLKFQFNVDWSDRFYHDYNHQYKYWQYFNSIDQGSYPLTRDFKQRFTFRVNHTLNPSTYYTISASYVENFYRDAIDDKTVITDPANGELISSEYITRGYYQGIEGNFRTGDVRYWTQTPSGKDRY